VLRELYTRRRRRISAVEEIGNLWKKGDLTDENEDLMKFLFISFHFEFDSLIFITP